VPSDEEQLLTSEHKQGLALPSPLKADVGAELDNDSESIDEDYEYDHDNILNKPIEFQPTRREQPGDSAVGLNIKQVECEDIDYEDSYN
jgi:hypothetical protein